jgi:putative sterol carrier protein
MHRDDVRFGAGDNKGKPERRAGKEDGMRFASMEYLEEVQRRTNDDEEHRRLAAGENDSYTMVLRKEPEKGISNDVTVGYRIEGGEITDIWEGQKDADFTLAARYGIWVDILRGKLDPVKALSLRKLKVKGNFFKLLKGSDSTLRWVEILRSIPTEFEGEYAQYNLGS